MQSTQLVYLFTVLRTLFTPIKYIVSKPTTNLKDTFPTNLVDYSILMEFGDFSLFCAPNLSWIYGLLQFLSFVVVFCYLFLKVTGSLQMKLYLSVLLFNF